MGRTVALKVRFADFTTITRSRTLHGPVDVTSDLYSTAKGLFDALGLQRARIRLVGIRVEGLQPAQGAARQLVLGEPDQGRREAEIAVDAIRARFGSQAVRAARLVELPGSEDASRS